MGAVARSFRRGLAWIVGPFAVLLLLVGSAGAASRRDTALRILDRYAPTGAAQVRWFEAMPLSYAIEGSSATFSPVDFTLWLTADDEAGIVDRLPTALHEMAHLQASRLAWQLAQARGCRWDARAMGIVLAPEQALLVVGTDAFPAREAASRIPPSLRGPRFAVYVTPSHPDHITQKHGIYGLLNEYAAYAVGARAALDLSAWYEEHGQARRFLGSANNIYIPQAEFRLFFRAWLDEARARHPETYRAVVGNAGFREALRRVDERYAATVAAWFRKRETEWGRLPEDPGELREVYHRLEAATSGWHRELF